MGENTDLKELIKSYTKHWKWFILSFLACIALAFFYVRYSVPNYVAEATIQISEEKDASSGLELFQEISLFSGSQNKVEDEIEIINSRSNLIEVVKSLGLNKTITVLGNIRSTNLYGSPPININFIAPDSTLNNADFEFFISYSSTTSFGYSKSEDEPEELKAFGKTISTPIGDMVITPNHEILKKYKESKMLVAVRPVGLIAQSYNERINIAVADEFSNIVFISLEDPNRQRAKDVINEVIRVYNQNAIKDKKVVADRTSDFIDARIAEISTSLSAVDQSAEDFKTGRGVTDIASEANINLNVGATNRQELANTQTQYNIASSMKDIVDQQAGYEVLPTNLGLSDPTIAGTTERFNQLVQERNRLLKSSNEKNPVIVNLDEQLSTLKRTMQASLNSAVNNLGLQVNTLSNQQAIINSKIYSAPSNERALRDITRRQQTTESLYLYLLQKREEAQIAVASTAQKCKVIDSAYNPTPFPISPNRRLIYLASLVFGFLLPFSVIYLNTLLDNKIHNLHGLEKLVNDVPILGEIPKLTKKEQKLVVKDDRSVLAESLRIIRTNLDYLIKTKQTKHIDGKKNNVIYVTSSVSGEGKTFMSSNLSMILASTGKRVLLVGADIRNPKIYSFFTSDQIDKLSTPTRNKDAGLTEYLLDPDLEIKDIINPMLVYHNEIDVIYSGKIPPNPAELLLSNRIRSLLTKVSQKYDYVIVDTAPLMMVTDTLLISEMADHLIYVVRADVTENRAVDFPIKLQEENKINGLCFVVNDVKAAELGYGGKYGYGYGQVTKKWWQF